MDIVRTQNRHPCPRCGRPVISIAGAASHFCAYCQVDLGLEEKTPQRKSAATDRKNLDLLILGGFFGVGILASGILILILWFDVSVIPLGKLAAVLALGFLGVSGIILIGIPLRKRLTVARSTFAVVWIAFSAAYIQTASIVVEWTSENGEFHFTDTESWFGNVVRRVARSTKSASHQLRCEGDVSESGKAHGLWRCVSPSGESAKLWFWYGEKISEGEWHLRNK